jgi:putative peptidoglycan lipid II flippase
MGVALWFIADALGPRFGAGTPFLERVGALTALVGGGLLVFAVAVALTGALDMRQLRGLLRRRAPSGPI